MFCQKGDKFAGVSVETGQIQNAVSELHVLDSLVAKRSAIQLAVDAAVTILRVDQVCFDDDVLCFLNIFRFSS